MDIIENTEIYRTLMLSFYLFSHILEGTVHCNSLGGGPLSEPLKKHTIQRFLSVWEKDKCDAFPFQSCVMSHCINTATQSSKAERS